MAGVGVRESSPIRVNGEKQRYDISLARRGRAIENGGGEEVQRESQHSVRKAESG